MTSEGPTFTKCQHCGKHSSPAQRFRACTRCYSVGYCSKDCQKSDWKGKDGHKSQCRTSNSTRARARPAGRDLSSPHKGNEDGSVVRLEVKSGDGTWKDAGPINLADDMASATINQDSTGDIQAPHAIPKNLHAKPNLTKELPQRTKGIFIPASNSYTYRHSSDGVDENLLIFLHGAGDSHLPYDALGRKMELPQTAILTLSASMSLNLSCEKNSNNRSSTFVELPFGLGHTWFEEMDYSTGEVLSKDNPHRLKSLKHAVELLDPLICSLVGIDSDENETNDATWIPERIFLFGFSAGACFVMELCRMWMKAGRIPLGGAICIAGGVSTREVLPDSIKDVTKGDRKSMLQTQPTDVLIIAGEKDASYTKEAAQLSKQLYYPSKVQIHVQIGKGHSMIESKHEMQVVMEFLSKRQVRRMVSLETHSG